MAYHAVIGPSSADRWSSCTASINEQRGKPNTSTEAARRGTCCHQMSEELLLGVVEDPQTYLGRKLVFWKDPATGESGECWADDLKLPADRTLVGTTMEIDQTMVNNVAALLDI